MYTFIFLWTPALSPNDEHIPHGLIFAAFMVACMAGSALAGVLMAQGISPEKYMQASNQSPLPSLPHRNHCMTGVMIISLLLRVPRSDWGKWLV